MKLFVISFLIALVVVFCPQLFADSLTFTAAALLPAAGADPSVLHTTMLGALGACFAMPLQAFVEHAIAEKPWMNTWAKSLKPLLPTLLAGVCSWVATRFGFNFSDVMTVAAAAIGGAHLVNQTSLASEAPAASKLVG